LIILQWLHDHPEYKSNPFYVSGISYGGIPVPILTQLISNGKIFSIRLHLWLQGYILGNPITKVSGILNYRVLFAYGMGLISEELYKSLKVSCKGEYEIIDPSNAACSKNMQAYNEASNHIYAIFIHSGIYSSQMSSKILLMEWITLVDHWANNKSVQEALHVRRETIGQWVSCSGTLPYTENAGSVVPYHANLSTKGYRSLIYRFGT
ncbi:unnamed protein product, partial [Coffea canephora]